MTGGPDKLTGRIGAAPNELLDAVVLGPQFAHESVHLLRHYLAIERVLVAEYRRMGVLSEAEAVTVADVLDSLGPADVLADRTDNFTDIAFAVERAVSSRIAVPGSWHVDRSRNDLQATAQRMYVRHELTDLVPALLHLADQVMRCAGEYLADPMVGQTHLQAAQVITPAFWLSAWVEELLAAEQALAADYDRINRCPLGAGAMSGQMLDWDRQAMAAMLGFDAPERHALVSVASRGWALQTLGSLSDLAVVLSRLVTDLMMWGSAGYGIVRLSDELSGISSAMPQKRNYPVLERIRGRTAHITSCYLDMAMVQRNTTYTNLVEVSKESSALVPQTLRSLTDSVALLGAVVAGLEFDRAAMRRSAEGEYLGGFALANQLTLQLGMPWRSSQVVAGEFISLAIAAGQEPAGADVDALLTLLAERGVTGLDRGRLDALVHLAFDTDAVLRSGRSYGGTAPQAVADLLAEQRAAVDAAVAEWRRRRAAIAGSAEP